MAHPIGSRVRHATLAAYRVLAQGDVRPLIDLLDPEIEWTERTGLHVRRTLRGIEAVAPLLEERTRERRVIAIRGASFERDAIVLSFREPRWDERPGRLRTLITRALDGTFTQTLAVEQRIERIESTWTLRY